MEILALVLFILLIVLSFWLRNVISKLKEVARKRQQTIEVLYNYIDKIDEINTHEMWSGEPMFREFKVHTESLIRFLQTDHIHEEIKFLYEE